MSLEDLIAAERARPAEPTTAQAKSIWRKLRNGAGAVVPPAFDVSPATTVVTLKAKIGAALSTAIGKVVVGTAVVGTVAGGTAAVVSPSAPVEVAAEEREPARPRGERASESTTRVAAAPAAEVAPDEVPAAEVPLPFAPPEVAMPVAPAEIATPVELAPANAPAVASAPAVAPDVGTKRRAKEPSTFGDEMALIRKAQRALAGGRPDAALAALAEHEKKFRRGSMVEDRLALRALALCSAGRRDEGRRAAKLLEQRFPRSLYAERVNERCR